MKKILLIIATLLMVMLLGCIDGHGDPVSGPAPPKIIITAK